MDIPKGSHITPTDTSFDRSARFWLAHSDELDRYRICCFSKSPREILMWSYYGNGHSGICIEGNYSEYSNWIHDVEYVPSLTSSQITTIPDQLRYKHEKWKHEEEARIILPVNSEGKFIKAGIQKVMIGASIDMRYIRPIMELCRLKGYPVEIASFSTSAEFHTTPLNNLNIWG